MNSIRRISERRTSGRSNILPFIVCVIFLIQSQLATVQAAELNVLIIGCSRDSADHSSISGTSDAFAATAIRSELESILSGAGLGTVNVTLLDRSAEGYSTDVFSLSQWFHYPYPADIETSSRWPNLRGESGTQWDYVILIGDPYTMEYMPGIYAQGVSDVAEEVAKGSAETVLLMSWPASGSNSSVAHYKDVVYRTGRSGGYKVAPAALAWQADGSRTGGSHPTTRGAYICAASIFSRIWGQSASASSYSYNDALADSVHTVVTDNIGVSQYSGTFGFQNPYLMLGDPRRDVHFSEKGTSTEDDYRASVANAMRRCRVAFEQASYSHKYSSSTPEDDGLGWPVGNPMPIAWNHGRKFAETHKEYVINPAYWQLGMGFKYQQNTWSSPIADANDTHISQVFVQDLDLADYMKGQHATARSIPWRLIWAQIHQEFPTLNPLRDGSGPHVNLDLREAVGTYMYTLYSGRCPLDPMPSPMNPTWFAQRVGYETAWRAGRCQTRAPGFKVLPYSDVADNVTLTKTQPMTVQFILPPHNDVTVNVSTSNNTAAIINPKTMTFTPDNHDTAQDLVILGLPGTPLSEDFNVLFTTSSSDAAYDELSDSWAYTNNRSATENLTVVNQDDRQEFVDKNTSKTISLSVTGSTENNTVILPPFHGSLAWSGSDVVYTPEADYVGRDSFAFAVNVNGQLTKGYVTIIVEEVPEVHFAHTDGNTTVTEGGAGDTYTVSLNMAPVSNVTVTLAPDAEVTVSASTLTFTPTDWDMPKSLTVNAANDTEHELIHAGIITHTTSSADADWSGVSADFLVTVVDNDNIAPDVEAGNNQSASLTGDPAPTATAGADIFLDAGQDDGANATWEDTLGAWDLTLDDTVAVVSHTVSPTTLVPGITGAYSFPGGQSGFGGGQGASFNGGWDTEPVSIEIWFKPNSTADDGKAGGQVLFETGGSSGLGIFYNDGTVEVGHDTTEVISSVDVSSLAGEFIQIVLTYDVTGSDDFVLYVNGAQAATGNRADTDWSGSDGAGLGARGDSHAGGRGTGDASTESFYGQIAMFRAYRNQILSATEVNVNYDSIAGGQTVTVDLSSASVSDADGDPTSTMWTVVSGPGIVTFEDATTVDTTATFREVGTYVLRLTANDGNGEVFDEVTITITEAGSNNAPVADAGTDQTVIDSDDSGAELVTLDGTASTDSDGTIVGWVWTEGGSQIATGATPDVTLSIGAHTITLTVTDDDGAVSTDTVVITVNPYIPPNTPPTANAGPDQTVTLTGGTPTNPTDGATIYLNAGLDDGSNSIWEDSLGAWDLSIDSNVQYLADAGSALPGITAAYDFPGGLSGDGGCSGLSLSDMGADRAPITIELWFKPDTSASYPDNGQVLWETGGTVGFGIFYRNGFVETAHDSNSGRLSADVSPLTGEFIQVVVTYDPTISTDNFNLYINGELKAVASRSDADMSGGDDAGLGKRGGNNVGGAGGTDSSTLSFDGKIAMFRSYQNQVQVLDALQVQSNYLSVASGNNSVTVDLVGAVDDADTGDIVTASWTVVGGDATKVSFADAASPATAATFTAVGTYTLRLTASDGTDEVFDDVIITVNTAASTIADVALPAGISLYGYTGENSIDAQTAFQALIDSDQLSLVRWVNPASGQIKELYYTTFPSAGWVNEIGDLTLGQGYVVKTTSACTLSIAGSKSTVSIAQDLPAGYSIIGYNKETATDAQAAFQALINANKLELVRWVDPSNGQIKELYYTTFPSEGWVNEIGNLTEGQGYIIKLNAAHAGFALP